jgi:hypothetical protein
MRFEVPQFIEVEDQIFGSLTWRQFLYLGGGIGMSIVILFTTNIIIFVLIGLPLALLSGALSFYPVNNRPFSFFLEALLVYFKSQRLYLWRQKVDIVYKARKPAETNYETHHAPKTTHKGVASLSRRLELQAIQKTEQ